MDCKELSPGRRIISPERLSAEAAFLLAALQRGAAAKTVAPPPSCDWGLLFRLALSHRVLPMLCSSGADLPSYFFSEFHQQIAQSLRLASVLDEILPRFEREAIAVITLKGPVLAQTLYGGISLRPSGDLDFLVRREDFGAAERLLLQSGFSPAGSSDDYHRVYERRGVFAELHFQVSPPSAPHFDLQACWSRAQVIDFRKSTTRVFSSIDQTLYLALHGLKHRFACLIWVMDIVRSVQSLSSFDAAALLAEARAQRLRNVLLAACEIANSMFAVDLPPEIASAISANPVLRAEANAVARQVLAGVADPTTSLAGSRDYVKFADPGRRWRQRLRFFLPTDQDYRWADRHGISRSCMAFLRPLRLARKQGVASSFRLLFPR